MKGTSPLVRHFLSAETLTPDQVRFFLDTAKRFREHSSPPPLLQGLVIVNLFFENSTRTRMSFELATRRLGGGVLGFAVASSSVSKGETLVDTAKNIEALNAHGIVIRHGSAGSPFVLARNLSVPVINAGDGFHEHPTQGLLDVFTMEDKLGSLKGKRVVIVGDIAHSRVARSNIYLLQKLGASVAVCAPPTLLPPDPKILGADSNSRLDPLLRDADAVMTLRIQLERQNKMQIPSLREYARFWGMNIERMKLMKPTAILLHPGPINPGVELDPEVVHHPRSVILDQVTNGVFIRMAVLAELCQPQRLRQWLGEIK